MKGVEIELVPHAGAVQIKTARFTALEDGRCVEVDGACLMDALKAFSRLSVEDVQRGKRVQFKVYQPTQAREAGSRKPPCQGGSA